MTSIAVIVFPGTNCEQETLRAVQKAGMDGKIIRWNTREKLEKYNGYIIPGGWSYEDRIRAGVIASKDAIINTIKAEGEKGKPILGICNGCQVLIESGMVPGTSTNVEMALAPNKKKTVSGYYCTWIYIKPKRLTAFTLDTATTIPMPIAHGEGRFTTRDDTTFQSLPEHITFVYTTEEGEETHESNPNGSLLNAAGIANKKGNILALMPHPERCVTKRQLPQHDGKFEELEQPGPGLALFTSMKKYIENGYAISR
jgi:phosphoribosylformylglycinamidine synthase subunit PurQ / glutaminase